MPQQKTPKAGVYPYRGGLYEKPRPESPWTIRQYAGFASAKESNLFYQQNLKAGQMGLSVAFDLPTHRGFDSDDPRAIGDVGKAGVAIDSVEDMAILFHQIPLDKMSVSMTMNGAVLPILASYIVVAEEQGITPNQLSGTIQNDILKEFLVRNTYIYPPEPSMRIVADIIHYASKNMPKFHPISISGYHMAEAGATPSQELALTLLNAIAYVKAALKTGLAVDDFAPRLSFFFGIGMDFFNEIAKLRAGRELWAGIMKEQFGAKNEKSMMCRIHCQTSGVSLTRQDPYNNIVRTTLEALSAVLGGTQSLHSNSFDEAIALPSPTSARLARNTQLILQKEMGWRNLPTPDPLGGSHYIEALTDGMIENCETIMEQINQAGGMIKAIERGIPQAMIEEEAIKKQIRFDNKEDEVVGVNVHPATEDTMPDDILTVAAMVEEQRQRLADLRRRRDNNKVKKALAELAEIAKDEKSQGLLSHTIHAMRARATVGEVSQCLAEVFHRHQVIPTLKAGSYEKNLTDKRTLMVIKQRAEKFEVQYNRKPKIIISKLGLDGHDRGAKMVASAFLDAGFEVMLAPLFLLPEEVADMAIEQGADIIGISSHTAGHHQLLPDLLSALTKQRKNIPVILGGIIPDQDKEFLINKGVKKIFDPAENINNILNQAMDILPIGLGHNIGNETP